MRIEAIMRWVGSEMSVEVVIERRQRADAAGHHRHRVRVAAEALEEAAHLLVNHRVVGDAVVEVRLLRLGRQLAVEQQIAGLEEVAVLGELLDRIAAVEQDAFVAVDIGDLGLAARRRGEARIVGEDAGLAVELGDVDDVRADRALVDRERVALLADRQLRGLGIGAVAGGVLASIFEPFDRCGPKPSEAAAAPAPRSVPKARAVQQMG